ncbi:MAG: signal peptidase II [Clostridia bacterium]|nr:signal peptidase II [Clostridia bacterium]
MKKWKAWICPGLAALAADWAVKTFLSDTEAVLIPGVIALQPARNTGMALGLMQGNALLIAGVSLALAALCVFLLRGTRVTGLGRFGLSLIAGGALGNLWDRLALGSVRDMFELLFVDFYVFNAADVAVVAGVILCAVSLLFRPRDWSKK